MIRNIMVPGNVANWENISRETNRTYNWALGLTKPRKCWIRKFPIYMYVNLCWPVFKIRSKPVQRSSPNTNSFWHQFFVDTFFSIEITHTQWHTHTHIIEGCIKVLIFQDCLRQLAPGHETTCHHWSDWTKGDLSEGHLSWGWVVWHLSTQPLHTLLQTEGDLCVCVCGFVIASNRGHKYDTLLSDRGRFENGDGPHPES